jgi:hypothetical protein
MTILDILREELKDISTASVLYHYTNAENLLKILESGYLQGQEYNTKASDKQNSLEIATMRKSKVSELKKTKKWEEMSPSIGKVKIILYKDRIKTLRNTYVKPIAEYPKSRLISYKRNEDFILNLLTKKGFPKEEVIEDLKNFKKGNKTALDKYVNNSKKLLDNKDKKAIKYTIEDLNIESRYITIFSQPKYKEGEERIINKNGNPDIIPLKKEYLKIVLEKGVLEELTDQVIVNNNFMLDKNDYNTTKRLFNNNEKLIEFSKYLISYKDIFEQNNEYNLILKKAKES